MVWYGVVWCGVVLQLVQNYTSMERLTSWDQNKNEPRITRAISCSFLLVLLKLEAMRRRRRGYWGEGRSGP